MLLTTLGFVLRGLMGPINDWLMVLKGSCVQFYLVIIIYVSDFARRWYLYLIWDFRNCSELPNWKKIMVPGWQLIYIYFLRNLLVCPLVHACSAKTVGPRMLNSTDDRSQCIPCWIWYTRSPNQVVYDSEEIQNIAVTVTVNIQGE